MRAGLNGFHIAAEGIDVPDRVPIDNPRIRTAKIDVRIVALRRGFQRTLLIRISTWPFCDHIRIYVQNRSFVHEAHIEVVPIWGYRLC